MRGTSADFVCTQLTHTDNYLLLIIIFLFRKKKSFFLHCRLNRSNDCSPLAHHNINLSNATVICVRNWTELSRTGVSTGVHNKIRKIPNSYLIEREMNEKPKTTKKKYIFRIHTHLLLFNAYFIYLSTLYLASNAYDVRMCACTRRSNNRKFKKEKKIILRIVSREEAHTTTIKAHTGEWKNFDSVNFRL